MLAQNLNVGSGDRDMDMDRVRDRVRDGGDADRDDAEQLLRENRMLRVRTTQLTEKNTELTLQAQAVDQMYTQAKAQLLAAREDLRRLAAEKETLEKERQRPAGSSQEEALRRLSSELHLLLARNKAPRTADNVGLSPKDGGPAWTEQVGELRELLQGYQHRVGELEAADRRSQAALRSLQARLAESAGSEASLERARDEIGQGHQQAAELLAQNHVLRQQCEELGRKADYFERARAGSSSRDSGAEAGAADGDGFAVELLLLEKSKLYSLLERYGCADSG